MRVQSAPATLLALLQALAIACSGGGNVPSPPPSTSSGPSCPTDEAKAPTGCWTQILAPGSGGYPPSPGSQNEPVWEPGKFPLTLTPRLAFKDELWMTGRTVSYSSPDGLTWTQHDKTDWGERIYHTIVYFKGTLWMTGGMDYEARTFLNDIWSSADGITWNKVGTAAWSGRGSHTMVVYQDRLWLLGGANQAAEDRSTNGFLNDIWVSDDGLAWTEVTGAAAWPPRDGAGAMVFQNQLYIVGGQGQADVWRSSNGKDWTQLTGAADWGVRHDYARVVFRDKLWVFGGWAGKSTNALNDVWYSTDGTTWNRQTEHAPWRPRGPVAIVFQDKIWIYSGKRTGGPEIWVGDLWQMTAA
jgi:N-acetylneuraminic acid mutarotase